MNLELQFSISLIYFSLSQVSLLSRIHHRNLVSFLGYCQEGGKNILVYEFMHNGTLKDHLFGRIFFTKSVFYLKKCSFFAMVSR